MVKYIISLCGVATSGKTTLAKEIAKHNKQIHHMEIDKMLNELPKNEYSSAYNVLDLYRHEFEKVFDQGKIPIIDQIDIMECTYAYIKPIFVYTPLSELIFRIPTIMYERQTYFNVINVIINQFCDLYTGNKNFSRSMVVGELDFEKVEFGLLKYFKFKFIEEYELVNYVMNLKTRLNVSYRNKRCNLYLRTRFGNSLIINKHHIEGRYRQFKDLYMPLIESEIQNMLKIKFN